MTMTHDLVSIITPMYNAEPFVAKTIESVLQQTYTNWEMIIVDDCSNDASVDVVNRYLVQDNRITLIQNEKNLNAAKSRNEAIKTAKGQYIAFLDSDDLWKKNKLEKQIQFMRQHRLFMTYSAYDLIDERGNKIGVFIPPQIITKKELLKTNSIGNLTGIYDVKKLGKLYMEDYGHEDYVLWLRVLSKIKSSKGITESLAQYRILKNNLSSNKIKTAKWQWIIYRQVEKLPLFKSIYYFIHYSYNGFMKYK